MSNGKVWTSGPDNSNNTYDAYRYGEGTVATPIVLDGLGGTDTVFLDARAGVSNILSRLTYNTGDGFIHFDATSGSSAWHYTLKNIETFEYGGTVIDLTSRFPQAFTENTAPTVSTFSPTDGATSVAVDSNIVLTFSEAIQAGTGTITLRTDSASGTIIESYDIGTPSSRITISGSTLTINPSTDLVGGTHYFVVLPSGVVKDIAGGSYAGTSEFDFTITDTPPYLLGTLAAEVLTGNANDDVLIGLGGIDTLDGSDGSDLYVMRLASEHKAAEIHDSGVSGIDEVRLSSTKVNDTLVLYAGDIGIERAVIGSGEAADAVTTGVVKLNIDAKSLGYGLALMGNNGANTLTGTVYADEIDGNLGKDKLVGLAGDDTYTVDLLSTGKLEDTVTEAKNAGTDTIILRGLFNNTKAVVLNMVVNVENIDASATGSSLLNLTGSVGANRLVGNDADNLINGGAGNDTLTGGGGSDYFVFDTAANASNNLDTIIDFSSGDKLQFSKKVFTGLGKTAGALSGEQFFSGAGQTAAHDASDRVIYDTTSGALYYDADGTGAAVAIQIAVIGTTTHSILSYSDFVIV